MRLRYSWNVVASALLPTKRMLNSASNPPPLALLNKLHSFGVCRVSITTCLISILGVPALYVYGKEGVPMAGQVAVMGTALAGTGCSTLLLNLCVSPYVFRMAEV